MVAAAAAAAAVVEEDEHDDDDGGTPFSLLEDRILSSSLPLPTPLPLRSLQWSPTMDLLAVVAAMKRGKSRPDGSSNGTGKSRTDKEKERGFRSHEEKGGDAAMSHASAVGVEISCFRLDAWARLWTTTMTARVDGHCGTHKVSQQGSASEWNQSEARQQPDEFSDEVCSAWAPHGKALAVAQSFITIANSDPDKNPKVVATPSMMQSSQGSDCSSSCCKLSLVDVEAGTIFSNISIPHAVSIMIWTYNNTYDGRPAKPNIGDCEQRELGNVYGQGNGYSHIVDDFAVTCAVERLQRSDRFTPNSNAGLNVAGNHGNLSNDERPQIVSEKTETSESEQSASIARNRMNAEMMMTMMMTPKSRTATKSDTDSKLKRSIMGFDLLIAAGHGNVSLFSKGVFQIATLNLNKVMKEFYNPNGMQNSNSKVILKSNPLSVNVNASCNEMAVMMEVIAQSSPTVFRRSICVATFNTHFSSPVVLSNILTASTHSTIILSLVESAIATLDASKDRHRSSLGSLQKKMLSLGRKLGVKPDVQEEGLGVGAFSTQNDSTKRAREESIAISNAIKREMHECLLHGAADAPALAHWLTVELGEATLRRIARGIDNECTNMYNAIVKNVNNDCTEMLFRLGELKSLAMVHQALNCESEDTQYNFDGNSMAGLGYPVQLLSQIEEDATLAMLLLEMYSTMITKRACTYRAFFSFLLYTIRTLNGESNTKNPNSSKNTADANSVYFDSDLVVEFIDDELDDLILSTSVKSKSDLAGKCYTLNGQLYNLLSSIPQSYISALGLSSAIERLKSSCLHFVDSNEISSFLELIEKVLNKLLVEIRETVKENLLKPGDNVVSPPVTLIRVIELESDDNNTIDDPDFSTRDVYEEDASLHSVVAPLERDKDDDNVGSFNDGFLVAFKSKRLHGDIVIVNIGCDDTTTAAAGDSLGQNSEASIARLKPPDSFTVKSIRHYKENSLALLLAERQPLSHNMETGSASSSEKSVSLALIDTSELDFKCWNYILQDLACSNSLYHSLQDERGYVIARHHLRSCGDDSLIQSCEPYLSVSGSRGVGCAVIGRRRIVVYDMESNDEDEDEDEDDNDNEDS